MDDLLKDDDELEMEDPLAPIKAVGGDDDLDPDIESAEDIAEEEADEEDSFDDVDPM